MKQDEIKELALSWVSAQSVDVTARSEEQWEGIYQVQDLRGEPLWIFILEVIEKNASPKVLQMLSAGPLEDLIEYDGHNFIDRVEEVASKDDRFSDLLKGVWLSPAADEPDHRYQSLGCQIVTVEKNQTDC